MLPVMGAGDAVRQVLRRYAVFDGRARRAEFWWFALVQGVVVAVPLTIGWTLLLVGLLVGASAARPGWVLVALAACLLVVGGAGAAALLVPFYAVAARRLHDTDRSALWLLLVLAPYASVVLYWFWAEDGRPGPNRFGPDPKGRAPVPWLPPPPPRPWLPPPPSPPWSVRRL